MVGDQGKTCIRVLRAAIPTADPLRLRLRLEQALATGDLTPRTLPPSAILCVRRLRCSYQAIREESVREALDQLVARAARPAREFVPADADCVIFGDRAEMLACLAQDGCEGVIGLRWWWRGLLPQLNGIESVLAAWAASPEYIPPAWQYLAKAGRAVQFAGQIGSAQAREMLRGVTRQFALGDLQDALNAVVRRAEPEKEIEQFFEYEQLAVSETDAGEPRRTIEGEFSAPVSPWQSWAEEVSDAALSPDQQLLLGIALTLHRAPALARTRDFALAVRHWIETVRGESHIANSIDASPPAPSDSLREIAATKLPQFELGAELRQPIVASAEDRSEQIEAFGTTEMLQEEDNETRRLLEDRAVGDGPLAESRSPAGALREPLRPVEGETSQRALYKPGEVEPLFEAQLSTGYGGLFYLLNLGLYLELYGDITTPSVRDIPLGAWDFLALLGERLVGEGLRRDPIWALLARLAGREPQSEPGRDCVMPEQWRMPAEWLRPFNAEGVWQWSAEEGRLRVWHPARFVVLDVPLEPGDPLEQLRREFIPRAATRLLRHQATLGTARSTDSLCRWMDWLTPYALARLQLALGLAEASEVGRALCQSLARVFVTATHLDVVFSLAELLVEIRLAGLDRDPGWIPATGRIIRFHYEG